MTESDLHAAYLEARSGIRSGTATVGTLTAPQLAGLLLYAFGDRASALHYSRFIASNAGDKRSRWDEARRLLEQLPP